jgi:hypothetical protein
MHLCLWLEIPGDFGLPVGSPLAFDFVGQLILSLVLLVFGVLMESRIHSWMTLAFLLLFEVGACRIVNHAALYISLFLLFLSYNTSLFGT